MTRTASRTANVYTRVDPETKEQAGGDSEPAWDSYVECNRNVPKAGRSPSRHTV